MDRLDGYSFFVITKRDDATRGLTREELLALPAAVDLETANRALSLSRTTGYYLARRGRYPCTVLRLGNAYRVVTADLLNCSTSTYPSAQASSKSRRLRRPRWKRAASRGVSEEPASDGHRLVCVTSTSPCHPGVAIELCRPVQRFAKGWGAQGERGRLWTVQHGTCAAGPGRLL